MKTKHQNNPEFEIPALMKKMEGSDLFEDITLDRIQLFMTYLLYRIEEYKAGEEILFDGEKSDSFAIIIDGEVLKKCLAEDEKLSRNADIGLIEASSTAKKRTCKYIADTDTVLLWTKTTHYVSSSSYVSSNTENILMRNLLRRFADKAL